jgi:hypothetical protein
MPAHLDARLSEHSAHRPRIAVQQPSCRHGVVAAHVERDDQGTVDISVLDAVLGCRHDLQVLRSVIGPDLVAMVDLSAVKVVAELEHDVPVFPALDVGAWTDLPPEDDIALRLDVAPRFDVRGRF